MRTLLAGVTAGLILAGCASVATPARPSKFDGSRALDVHVMAQTNLGPRPVGSAANRATGDYIAAHLKGAGWAVESQEFEYRRVPIRNIIGRAAVGRGPVIILGAHYDTRVRADRDRSQPGQPVLGANDGASGVAVLLELASTLDISKLNNEIWLAFFDAEDHGDLSGCLLVPPPCTENARWPFSVGAEYAAEHLGVTPSAVVVIDMIGDKDQNIYFEQNSDAALRRQLWEIAATLGYSDHFIPESNWSLTDDHTPFLKRGIPAVVIIDFDYSYWHTVEDTADKLSAASLGRVGNVLQVWLEGR